MFRVRSLFWLNRGMPVSTQESVDHFTVECLVAWPLNQSEAGFDLVLVETSVLFLRS